MKRLLASCLLAAAFPAAVSAATAEELQAQIQTLLQQINVLQQSVQAAPATGGVCPSLTRTLQKGMSGTDVTQLQQFLASNPTWYPEGTVTGYFGVLTETAVKRFQCAKGIICDGTPASTGYGLVGPRTAAAIRAQCGGVATPGTGTSGNVGGYMRINPISGAAPLNTAIEVHVNTTRACTGGSYELIFGDNEPPVRIEVPVGTCTEIVQTYTHIYRNPGSYIVTLRSGAHQSTATVTVSGQAQGSDDLTASPRSGTAPLNVSFSGTANANGSCSPQSYYISFGDDTNVANIPVSSCSISTFAVTHTYQTGGDFTARLVRGGSQADSVSIDVDGPTQGSTQGGGSFSVSPGYGGDAFAVLAQFELASACTAYDINWGDGTPHASQSTGTCSAGTASKEVSHTYSGNGTYTITLKRGTGSTQTTDTVGVTVVY